jgi:hypothetical protein
VAARLVATAAARGDRAGHPVNGGKLAVRFRNATVLLVKFVALADHVERLAFASTPDRCATTGVVPAANSVPDRVKPWLWQPPWQS